MYAPPCGISLLNHSNGTNTVDFGFEVDDRFILANNGGVGVFTEVNYGKFSGIGANRAQVITWDAGGSQFADEPFTIIVF